MRLSEARYRSSDRSANNYFLFPSERRGFPRHRWNGMGTVVVASKDDYWLCHPAIIPLPIWESEVLAYHTPCSATEESVFCVESVNPDIVQLNGRLCRLGVRRVPTPSYVNIRINVRKWFIGGLSDSHPDINSSC
jgi:hypothetical protein